MNETELLRRFVKENAQDALAELVRGKIDLVYATALRQVGGDAHLAQDVTQGMFLALTCQAAKLQHHTLLTGWLFLNFMGTTKLILGTVGAIVVFGVGAFVGGHSSLSGGSAAKERATIETREELARLRKENVQLNEQLQQNRAAQSNVLSSKGVVGGLGLDASAASKKWALLAELYKKKLLTSRLSFVDNAGALNPAIASVFDLTPDEHMTLSYAIDTAREKIETLERANATVTRQPDGNFVIEVKPFPAAGGPVYDELMANISQILGPDRTAAYLTLGADQVEKALGSFGAMERKVTITSQPDSTGSRYLATDERNTPSDHSRSTSNYSNREELLTRIGTITKLLPTDF